MNESNRMQYLDAMGIEMFVPRKILPAAKMSVACPVSYIPVSEPAESSAHALSGQSISGQSISGKSSAASSLEPLPFDKGSLTPSTPSMATQAIMSGLLNANEKHINHEGPANNANKSLTTLEQSANKNEPIETLTLQQLVSQKKPQLLRFNLSFWQLDNGAVFIDTREPKAALPTTTLLRNIVQAIMPAVSEQGLLKPDAINWPLQESSIANPNELTQAREMTQAFLNSRFEKAAPTLIIIMGEQAFNVVAGDQMRTPEYGQWVEATHLSSRAVYLPSLTQLLNEPLLKRFIWPAIAPYFLKQDSGTESLSAEQSTPQEAR